MHDQAIADFQQVFALQSNLFDERKKDPSLLEFCQLQKPTDNLSCTFQLMIVRIFYGCRVLTRKFFTQGGAGGIPL